MKKESKDWVVGILVGVIICLFIILLFVIYLKEPAPHDFYEFTFNSEYERYELEETINSNITSELCMNELEERDYSYFLDADCLISNMEFSEKMFKSGWSDNPIKEDWLQYRITCKCWTK